MQENENGRGKKKRKNFLSAPIAPLLYREIRFPVMPASHVGVIIHVDSADDLGGIPCDDSIWRYVLLPVSADPNP